MLKQKKFRLSVRPVSGETTNEFRSGFDLSLTRQPSGKIPPEKLLADLLKRQAKRICADVSECPPAALPAHLARLDDWRESAEHHNRHCLSETPESRLSGRQLLYPSTVADWLAVADITRREHRCPSFLNSRDDAFQKITHRIDLLAGLILQDEQLTAFLSSDERGQL
jgi:hypothetical protein